VLATDPRPPSGNLRCGDQSLVINQYCPGFDNTGKNLAIPGYLCGNPGIALVKTATDPSQYDHTYVESAGDAKNLLTSNNDAVCGPPQLNKAIDTLVWAPLAGEGTIVETTTVDDLSVPSMADITNGCGDGHGGSGNLSLWAVGLTLDANASELTSPFANPFANFANTKYTNLTATITNLTQPPSGTGTIIADGLSAELWNHNMVPLGCIDQSWTIFTNAAMNESGAQQAQDFQNAADLLTNADTANNTTCDSIVTNNLGQITQTPNTNPPVWNPSGQIRSRLANLYYTINTLVIGGLGVGTVPGNSVASVWPPPVAISVSPQSFNQGHSATLSWAINAGDTGCTWSTNDTFFTQANPVTSGSTLVNPQNTGTYYYTLMCTVPAGTVPPPATTMSATTYLTVNGE
jgi:hypothetical protein